MINQAIGPEPNLWFSQTRPRFIQNCMVNSLKLQNAIIYQGVWGPKTSFGPSQMTYQAISPEPMWNGQHASDEHNI